MCICVLCISTEREHRLQNITLIGNNTWHIQAPSNLQHVCRHRYIHTYKQMLSKKPSSFQTHGMLSRDYRWDSGNGSGRHLTKYLAFHLCREDVCMYVGSLVAYLSTYTPMLFSQQQVDRHSDNAERHLTHQHSTCAV